MSPASAADPTTDGPAARAQAGTDDPGAAVRHSSFHRAAAEGPPGLFESPSPAIIEPVGLQGGRVVHRVISYRDLFADVARLASSLARHGVRPGDRVLIMQPMSIALYQTMLATLKLDAVCLFIDPADGLATLDATARRMQPAVFVGPPRAHVLRLLCPAIRRARLAISTAPAPWRPLTLDGLVRAGDPGFPTSPARPDDPAVVSFTSGRSGRQKGVRRTHADLRAQFAMLCRHEGKRLPGVNLCAFPVLPIDDICAGRTSLLACLRPGRAADDAPALLVDQIRSHPPVLVSCPPPMLDRILSHAAREGLVLDSVLHVYTGGGPVAPTTIRRARQVMPRAKVHVVYGSTEAEPVAMIDGDEVLADTARRTAAGDGHCLGRLAPDTHVAIVHPEDGPIDRVEPTAGIGEILVRGPHVNQEYIDDPAATLRHKVQDPGSGHRWHRSGDLGYLDGDHRLWWVGRSTDAVVLPPAPGAAGCTLYPGQVEPVFEDIPGVRRAALLGLTLVRCGTPQAAAVLLLEAERVPTDTQSLLAEARRRAADRALPLEAIEIVGRIPTDRRIGTKTLYADLAAREGPRLRRRLSDPLPGRLATYLDERLPFGPTLVAAAVYALAVAGLVSPTWWRDPGRVAAAVLAVFLFFAHLRIFDEEKDHEVDRVVHPGRALSRGIVTLAELTPLRTWAIALGALLALLLGPRALAWWTLAFAYSCLMRVEFFASATLRRHLLLYGLSHSCVMVFLTHFVAASCTTTPAPHAIAFIAWCLAWLAEITRKLAPPQPAGPASGPLEESYVRTLGLGPTVGLVASLELGVLVLGSMLGVANGAGTSYVLVLAATVAPAALAALAFRRNPTALTARRVDGLALLLALVQYTLLAARPLWWSPA